MHSIRVDCRGLRKDALPAAGSARTVDLPRSLVPSSKPDVPLLLVGGGELAELCNGGGDGFEGEGDVRTGGVAAETEADGGAGFFGWQADGGEDMGGFDSAGRAGGSCGAGEAL